MILQRILSPMRKAIEDYKMIQDGDKIAVRIIWWKRLYQPFIGFKKFTNFLSPKI